MCILLSNWQQNSIDSNGLALIRHQSIICTNVATFIDAYMDAKNKDGEISMKVPQFTLEIYICIYCLQNDNHCTQVLNAWTRSHFWSPGRPIDHMSQDSIRVGAILRSVFVFMCLLI